MLRVKDLYKLEDLYTIPKRIFKDFCCFFTVMNTLKIFKRSFRFFTQMDSNQKPFDLSSTAPLLALRESVHIRIFLVRIFPHSEYFGILRISPNSVRTQENTNQKNYKYWQLLRSVCYHSLNEVNINRGTYIKNFWKVYSFIP